MPWDKINYAFGLCNEKVHASLKRFLLQPVDKNLCMLFAFPSQEIHNFNSNLV